MIVCETNIFTAFGGLCSHKERRRPMRPALTISISGFLLRKKTPKLPQKTGRFFLRGVCWKNPSRVFLAAHNWFQTVHFLCTQSNPVYCSLQPPQQGCVLHIIYLFRVSVSILAMLLRDSLPVPSLQCASHAAHPSSSKCLQVLQLLSKEMAAQRAGRHVSLLKNMNPQAQCTHFGVWLVDSTSGSVPSAFLSSATHASTADHRWITVPLNGSPPAVSTNQHPSSSATQGPLPNRRPALTSREDQTAAEGPSLSLIPHAISITPIFRRAWQGGFCKLWLPGEATSGRRVGRNLYVPSVSILEMGGVKVHLLKNEFLWCFTAAQVKQKNTHTPDFLFQFQKKASSYVYWLKNRKNRLMFLKTSAVKWCCASVRVVATW